MTLPNGPLIYSDSHECRKPINQVNFSERLKWFISKSFTLLHTSVYPLSFDNSYKMYWPCMAKDEPLHMVMSTLIGPEYDFRGLTGSEMVQQAKGRVDKTFISISFVSNVMFRQCLDYIFWYGLSSMTYGHIILIHDSSAQRDFKMQKV